MNHAARTYGRGCAEMQFKSPRFAGDVVLQQILDDPDTGTKKLQSGSDSSAVQKVQALLFDLDWLRRLDTD